MMLRSWMFVPGDSEKMLGKSAILNADALIFDLEDAVAEDRKSQARLMVQEHLFKVDRGSSQLWVRINALDTSHFKADLDAVMQGKPHGIVLPKAEHGRQAEQLASELDRLEAQHGMAQGQTRIALIAFETPLSVLNIATYQSLHPRVLGLSWGAEDMASAIGAQANRDEHGQYTAPYILTRSYCLMAAAAAGVQAIDTAYTDFRNAPGLKDSCTHARRDGFLGKIAIHPAQLEDIHAAFTPSSEELQRARRIVAAFAAKPGAGIVELDGKMLDKPHLQQARRLLEAGEAVA
jgi:citrate lyase subunit beta/citryl-CoA lyase